MLAMQVTVFTTYCTHIIEKQNLIISVRERSHNSSVLTTQHLHIHTHKTPPPSQLSILRQTGTADSRENARGRRQVRGWKGTMRVDCAS